MITILGQHISLIRPSLGHQCKVYKNEHLKVKYNKRPKTNKAHTGKVIAICVKLTNGDIKSLPVPATHIQICEKLVANLKEVAQTGWQLENKNYVWR